jgi:hypothetical protein
MWQNFNTKQGTQKKKQKKNKKKNKKKTKKTTKKTVGMETLNTLILLTVYILYKRTI